MRKISGQLLSSEPVPLDRAAKILTNFASADNGSSATVSLYLQRTADSFNDLLHFHSKRSKHAGEGNGTRRKRARTSESGENPADKTAEGLKIGARKDNEPVNGPNPNEDEGNASEKEQRKAKKKKKRVKNDGDEGLGI